jgi:alpha-1,3-rhamnosyl/mannosyltransferase
MRICVDVTPLLLRSVGVKTYFYHWIRQLLRISSPQEILAFPRIREIGTLDHEKSLLGFFSTSWRRTLLRIANAGVPHSLDLLLPDADLFHISTQLRKPPEKLPLSATIHDCTVWLCPELHTQRNVRQFKSFAEAVFKRAKGLIAVSEHTKSDAVRILGLNPNRIEVIYSGVSDEYFEAHKNPSPFTRPYILCVGTIEPRKNLNLLLDAYAQLSTSTRDQFDLMIVGPAGWKSEGTMARLLTASPGVRYLGYVPESEMPAVVAGATVMAYPSLYEGFGFPVAEAMACGVPVITSNVSSLPEVMGDAGLLIDPQSVGDLRDALESLLTSPSLRSCLGERGAVRSRALFRWQTCAQKSLAFFRRLTSN